MRDIDDGRAIVTLYEHARRLLADHPDGPLPRQGEPFPDEDAYRRRWHWRGYAHGDADAKALAQRFRAEGGPRVAKAVGAFSRTAASSSVVRPVCCFGGSSGRTSRVRAGGDPHPQRVGTAVRASSRM